MQFDWNAAYRKGFTPWDMGAPSELLSWRFEGLPEPRPVDVLELGCGTGHDARWLAGQGCRVVAADVSELALERARSGGSGTAAVGEPGSVRWVRCDLKAGLPVAEESQDLVYDTGLFHHLSPEDKARLADRVRAVLRHGGRWLSVSGSAEQDEDVPGPPGLTASEIVAACEPSFVVEDLRAAWLGGEGPGRHAAWSVVLRRR